MATSDTTEEIRVRQWSRRNSENIIRKTGFYNGFHTKLHIYQNTCWGARRWNLKNVAKQNDKFLRTPWTKKLTRIMQRHLAATSSHTSGTNLWTWHRVNHDEFKTFVLKFECLWRHVQTPFCTLPLNRWDVLCCGGKHVGLTIPTSTPSHGRLWQQELPALANRLLDAAM